MVTCFLCHKEIGPLREKYSINDYKNERVIPPQNFTEDDRTCASCFHQLKRVEEANRFKYEFGPTVLVYFAPIFLGILGGVLMYIAVKEHDPGMANRGVIVGTIITFIQIIIIFAAWGSIMSSLGNIGSF